MQWVTPTLRLLEIYNMSEFLKNSLASYFFIAIMIISAWVLNPYLLIGLGSLQFAIWKSSQKFIELACGLDGGAVQSLKWFTAKNSSDKESLLHIENLNYAKKLLKRWLPFCLLIIAVVAIVEMNTLTKNQTIVKSQVVATILVAGLASVIGLYAQLYESVVIGFRLGYKTTTLRIFSLIIINGLMIYVAQKKSGMIWIAACFALNIFIISIGFIHFGRKLLRGSQSEFSKTKYMRFRVYGRGVWIWEFAQRTLIAWELLLFTILGLPSIISAYVFSTFIYQFGLAITLQSVSALTPRLASMINLELTDNVAHLVLLLRKITLFLGSFIVIVIIFQNEYLVMNWVGSSYYLGFSFNVYFAVTFFQLMMIRVDSQIIESALDISKKAQYTTGVLLFGTALSLMAYHFTSSLLPVLIILGCSRLFLNIILPRLVSDLVLPINWPIKKLIYVIATITSAILVKFFLLITFVNAFVITIAYLFLLFLLLVDKKTRFEIAALFRKDLDASK